MSSCAEDKLYLDLLVRLFDSSFDGGGEGGGAGVSKRKEDGTEEKRRSDRNRAWNAVLYSLPVLLFPSSLRQRSGGR